MHQKSGLIRGAVFGESGINIKKGITVSIFLKVFNIRIFKFFGHLLNLYIVQDE